MVEEKNTDTNIIINVSTSEDFDNAKRQLIEVVSKQLGVSKKEVEDTVENQSQLLLLSPKYQGKWLTILNLLQDSLRMKYRKVGQQSQDMEVIFFGKERETDFGNTKKLEELKSIIKTDKQTAIVKGLCDDEGRPLHQTGYKKGKPVDVNDLYSRNIYGLINYEGDIHLMKFVAKRKALSIDFPMFRKLKIRGSVTPPKADKPLRFLSCGSTDETVGFEVLDNNIVNFEKKIIPMLTEEIKYDIETYPNKIKTTDKEGNPLVIYDSFWIKEMNIVYEGKNDYGFGIKVIEVKPFEETTQAKQKEQKGGFSLFDFSSLNKKQDDSKKQVQTIEYQTSVDYDLEITAQAMGYVIGKSYLTKENKVGINVLGVWVEPQYRKKIIDGDVIKDMASLVKKMESKVEAFEEENKPTTKPVSTPKPAPVKKPVVPKEDW